MKLRIGGAILGVLILTGSSVGVLATMKNNPYDIIAARNAFGLRPIPPPKQVEVEPVLAPPLPEIKLTGITTLSGISKALFQYEDRQMKKIEFPFPLAEGETYKTFTVLGIDVENQRVLIQNGEAQAVLDFANHGVKPPLAANISAPIHRPPNTPPTISLIGGPASYTNSRVVVVGGGSDTSSSAAKPSIPRAMTRNEAEALIEIARGKLQMQEQAGQTQPGLPHSQIFPPPRVGDALNQPFPSPPR